MSETNYHESYSVQVELETKQGWVIYRRALELVSNAAWDEALTTLAEAETTFRLCDHGDGVWRTLIVQSLLHYHQGATSLAMARALAALRTASVADNHVAIGWVQWQIALLALSRADYQGAAEFLSQAQIALDRAGVAPPGGPLARSAQLCKELLRWQELHTRGKIDPTEAEESIAHVRSDLEAWLRESVLAFGNRQVIDNELLSTVPIMFPGNLLLPVPSQLSEPSARTASLRVRISHWWKWLFSEETATAPEAPAAPPSVSTQPMSLLPQPRLDEPPMVCEGAVVATEQRSSSAIPVEAREVGGISESQTELVAEIPSLVPQQANPIQELVQVRRSGLVVYMFGNFRALFDDVLIQEWESARAREIFKYLVLYRAAPVPKEVLAASFWPDSEPELARRSLHQAIYCLRQTFKQPVPDLQLIQFADDCYRLNPAVSLWVDIDAFQQAIDQARAMLSAERIEEALRAYAVAVDLYSGEFLAEDRYSSWTEDSRYAYQSHYLEALHQLARSYVERKDFPAAIALCQRALMIDACDESAHQLLIVSYMSQGLRHLAVRQYQTCSNTLKNQLGLTPSDELETFYRQYVAAA